MVRDSLDASLDRLVAALRADDPECVYLVGSAARDEADELSDLDIVVIKRTEAPFLDRRQELPRSLLVASGGRRARLHARRVRDDASRRQRLCRDDRRRGPSPLWRPRGSLRPRAGTDRRPTI